MQFLFRNDYGCIVGVDPGFTKRGGTDMYIVVNIIIIVCRAYILAQSMPNLGESEGMPPQKILKNYTL